LHQGGGRRIWDSSERKEGDRANIQLIHVFLLTAFGEEEEEGGERDAAREELATFTSPLGREKQNRMRRRKRGSASSRPTSFGGREKGVAVDGNEKEKAKPGRERKGGGRGLSGGTNHLYLREGNGGGRGGRGSSITLVASSKGERKRMQGFKKKGGMRKRRKV